MSELVIMVTPELVAPLEPHQTVPLPSQDLSDPNDFELYFLGMLEGTREANAANSFELSSEGHLSQATRGVQPDELSIHGPWGHAGFADSR
jgi:Flp pilus assembly secretin CpaC